MAKRGQVFLDGDSDEDSINTTTTAASEEDADQECGVEKILSEDVNKDTGEVRYLLKWEGYPLHRCTWEPSENITSQILFRDWAKEKLAHKTGKVKPFDLDQFFLAVEQHEDERDEKHRRRIAKRRKRGEIVPSTEEGELSQSEDEDLEVLQRSSKRKKVKAPAPKRKGVALPVTKTREVICLDSDDDSDGGLSASSEESIPKRSPKKAKASSTTAKVPTKQPKTTVAQPASSAASNQPAKRSSPSAKTPVPSKTAEVATSKPASAATRQAETTVAQPSLNDAAKKPALENKRPGTAPTPPKTAEASVAKPAPPATTAARKSVSTAASKTVSQKPAPTSKVFGGDWTADKKSSRQRVRVSGETPKDSTDPKFVNLSTQNRYQKYSKNEPTPDISAITIIDPKTGRTEPPKVTEPSKQPAASTKQGPANIHSAYSTRVRTPPPTSRVRPTSPPTPAGQHPPLPTRGPAPPAIDTNQDNAKPMTNLPTPATDSAGISTKDMLCKHWQAGVCYYTADQCPYAHAYTPNVIYSKAQTTCWYWKKRGVCKFTDDECEFAHYDTGIEAGRPGTFKRRNSSALGLTTAQSTNFRSAMGGSSPNEAQEFFDTAEQPIQPPQIPAHITRESEDVFHKIVVGNSTLQDKEMTQPVTSQMGDASAGHIHASDNDQSKLTETSSLTKNPAVSPAKDPRLRPAPVTARNSVMDSPTLAEPMDGIDRSIETDLKMARQYIGTLDYTRLLKDSGGQIDNVYIHMPHDRQDELHLLRKFFQRFNCKVYSQSNEVNQWAYFRETFEKSCLLVFHPSETFIGTVPGLYQYLIDKGNKVRVFSIGVQHSQCILEMREPAYEARRLFPNGGITFITDDVFVYYPEKATEIIEAFLADAESKPIGAHSTKIGARPGVKEWMVRLAMRKFEEGGGEGQCTDMRWVQCYDALCRLCPIEDEDLDYPDHSVPLETSHLWSVWEESLPSFKGRWESGDEEGATDYMANHFAGEACDKAWQYRKFQFVYQRPGMEKEITNSQGAKIVKPEVDPKGWMKKYCHIGVVTPEQALKSIKK